MPEKNQISMVTPMRSDHSHIRTSRKILKIIKKTENVNGIRKHRDHLSLVISFHRERN